MSESNDLTFWENLLQMEKLTQEENEKDFKEVLNLFSKFLVKFDRQYYYNETFLPLFADDFLLFIKSFCDKYPSVEMIIKAVAGSSGIKLVVDRYWQYVFEEREEGGKKGEYSIYENPNFELVCSKNIRIECSLSVGAKHFKFHKAINISEDAKRNEEEIKNLTKELKEFIKKNKGKK